MAMEVDFYRNLQIACDKKGISVTRLITDCGYASSNTARLKDGGAPRIDMVMAFAKHLGMSIDELIYGDDHIVVLSDDDEEMLSIYRAIPSKKREVCKDFLRTHLVSYDVNGKTEK